MDKRNSESRIVTLMLQDPDGALWPLRLSANCLRFVGRYQRIDGFEIDSMVTFDGLRRDG